jgi:hypothetical protein
MIAVKKHTDSGCLHLSLGEATTKSVLGLLWWSMMKLQYGLLVV